eukprot:scaffold125986_cov16-Prasinocladus_malaysianus.AAC.2
MTMCAIPGLLDGGWTYVFQSLNHMQIDSTKSQTSPKSRLRYAGVIWFYSPCGETRAAEETRTIQQSFKI